MTKVKTIVLLSALCVAFLKSLIISPTFPDVAVIAVIGVIFAYLEYKNKDKDLEKLTAAVTNQQIEIEELKNKVSSIKMVQSVKPGALNFR